jgi:hypothetical protein
VRANRDTANNNYIIVEANYTSNQEFRLALGAVAGAFEAAVTLPRNCFYVQDATMNYRYCNAPLAIAAYTERLKPPVLNRHDDSAKYRAGAGLRVFMTNTKWPRSGRGMFHCCTTREAVDAKLTPLLPELRKLYPKPRSMERNVQCHLGCDNGDTEGNINIDEILKQAIPNRV